MKGTHQFVEEKGDLPIQGVKDIGQERGKRDQHHVTEGGGRDLGHVTGREERDPGMTDHTKERGRRDLSHVTGTVTGRGGRGRCLVKCRAMLGIENGQNREKRVDTNPKVSTKVHHTNINTNQKESMRIIAMTLSDLMPFLAILW